MPLPFKWSLLAIACPRNCLLLDGEDLSLSGSITESRDTQLTQENPDGPLLWALVERSKVQPVQIDVYLFLE